MEIQLTTNIVIIFLLVTCHVFDTDDHFLARMALSYYIFEIQ